METKMLYTIAIILFILWLLTRSGHDERLGWFCAFVTDRSGCRAAVRHSVREALVIANSVLTGK